MVFKMSNEHSNHHDQMKLLKLTPLFIHQQFTINPGLEGKKIFTETNFNIRMYVYNLAGPSDFIEEHFLHVVNYL